MYLIFVFIRLPFDSSPAAREGRGGRGAGTLSRLHVYESGVMSQVEVYERGGKSVLSVCKRPTRAKRCIL